MKTALLLALCLAVAPLQRGIACAWDSDTLRDEAKQKGSLYDYIGGENAYKSPQDPTARERSYSLNSFVGVMYCDDYYKMPGNISASTYTFDTRTISRIQKPAETLLALPEWDQT